MILSVRPADFLKGHIPLPASKSYAIRSFLIAACGGISAIINPFPGDDVRVAMRVARHLGARIKTRKNTHIVSALQKKISCSLIDVGESGTVLRFILPLLAARGCRLRVIGRGTLCTRPNRHLTAVLRQMGSRIAGCGLKESVPITLKGGRFRGGRVSIEGTLSSQFISALLISCPLLPEDTLLTIKGKDIVSEAYVTMTRRVLQKAGIRIEKKERRTFFIPGNQIFKGLKSFHVPSDYGLAAFFLAAGTLLKSNLILDGQFANDLPQADGKILTFLKRMGARFRQREESIKISGPFSLRGGSFLLKDCPDLVPIMAVLALFAKGKTRLYGIGHVRAKESDRISDLRHELLKIGADIQEKTDELIITPRPSYRCNVLLDPHHDHRLAMAFSILGLKLGARIKDMECTAKSYPQFVRDLKGLRGIKVSKG